MRILHVASEVAPWAQTGGLADVVAALPAAVAAISPQSRTATVAPLYRAARAELARAGIPLGDGLRHEIVVGGHRLPAQLRPVGAESRTRIWLLDCPPLYDRDGIYQAPDGRDWPDNALRFAALDRAAIDLAAVILGGEPDVVHGHDWQAGLALLFSRQDGRPASTIQTVHNLAYRGLFDKHTLPDLGLSWSLFNSHQLEFWDQISFLKAGMAFADVVTTVSPTYAEEILTAERGEGLDGFLRHDVRRRIGIVNGIDPALWNPATDPHVPANFDASDLRGKTRCREAVMRELGLSSDRGSIFAVAISRMAAQKGIDLLADLVPELASMQIKLAILGAGERDLEQRWLDLAEAFPDDVAARIGFDQGLSRRLYAGADLFVMPSRFEPCGLGQLYAMRYGAVPVVAAIGGLRDTVFDPVDDPLASPQRTGFQFAPVSTENLRRALVRATHTFAVEPAAFARVRIAGMTRDSSWTKSAHQYLRVYQTARSSS